jgi:glycosyltransferase involved in cell wall biosynthesis
MIQETRKILIIGGITWRETDHPRLGGTTVLMDNFIDYCIKHHVPHVVIPTNKYYGSLAGVRNLLIVLSGLIKQAKRGDVAMVNVSSKPGLITLFPIVVFFSSLLGLQVVCRKFAGSVHKYLEAKKYRKKIALHYLKRTKVSFFETEELLKWFEKNGCKAAWFPNVRESCGLKVPKLFEKRLVFIAQVYEDKGVDILLHISNRLPNDYQIDIFGPIISEKYTEEYFKQFRACYKGTLKPEEVARTLAQYNVMVFPTWWHSEGYPGVIIEAFSVGMPVISTRQGGIPEMIVNGESGLLTDVKDENAFEDAILSINQKRYEELCTGAMKRFEVYNSELVNPRIVSKILD